VSIGALYRVALTVAVCPRLAVARSDEKFLHVRKFRAILGHTAESALCDYEPVRRTLRHGGERM
jgi:hypothetical protein